MASSKLALSTVDLYSMELPTGRWLCSQAVFTIQCLSSGEQQPPPDMGRMNLAVVTRLLVHDCLLIRL